MVLPEGPHVIRLEIALIVMAHDFLHCCRSFGSMIEWNTRDMVMHNVRFDCAVEEDSADETKVSVYS
jgi:hypothetical protein